MKVWLVKCLRETLKIHAENLKPQIAIFSWNTPVSSPGEKVELLLFIFLTRDNVSSKAKIL